MQTSIDSYGTIEEFDEPVQLPDTTPDEDQPEVGLGVLAVNLLTDSTGVRKDLKHCLEIRLTHQCTPQKLFDFLSSILVRFVFSVEKPQTPNQHFHIFATNEVLDNDKIVALYPKKCQSKLFSTTTIFQRFDSQISGNKWIKSDYVKKPDYLCYLLKDTNSVSQIFWSKGLDRTLLLKFRDKSYAKFDRETFLADQYKILDEYLCNSAVDEYQLALGLFKLNLKYRTKPLSDTVIINMVRKYQLVKFPAKLERHVKELLERNYII